MPVRHNTHDIESVYNTPYNQYHPDLDNQYSYFRFCSLITVQSNNSRLQRSKLLALLDTNCLLYSIQTACSTRYKLLALLDTNCLLYSIQTACSTRYKLLALLDTNCLLYSIQTACSTRYKLLALRDTNHISLVPALYDQRVGYDRGSNTPVRDGRRDGVHQ